MRTAPRHARHVPPSSGRRQVPHHVVLVRIRIFPPPLHSLPMPYKSGMIIGAQCATADMSCKISNVSHVQGISLAITMGPVVQHVAMATELLVRPRQIVNSVYLARSVSMHRTGCKVLLVFVTTAWQHTILLSLNLLSLNPPASNALSTRIPNPAMWHVNLVKLESTASEA